MSTTAPAIGPAVSLTVSPTEEALTYCCASRASFEVWRMRCVADDLFRDELLCRAWLFFQVVWAS